MSQTQGEKSGQPAMKKADELVGRLEERLGHYISLISLQIQKAAARMREEAEDMWAEAQDIHHRNSHKLQ